MKRAAATFVLLFLTWISWSGHTTPLMLGFGVVSCALCVYLSVRLGVLDEEVNPFRLTPRLVVYFPWLLWQIVKSNIAVAKLILTPSLPIRPHLIRIPADQTTELGQVIHANTITITPGTVTLDLREGRLLVHAITDESAEGDLEGVVNQRICELEG